MPSSSRHNASGAAARHPHQSGNVTRLGLAIGVFALLTPSIVMAHAEEPNARSVFAVGEEQFVVRANFGVLTSDAPQSFVCEEAFLGGDGWLLGALGPTEWVTFGQTSVQRTTDGCSFEKVRDLPQRPSDAHAHRTSGVLAYTMNGDEDAGVWFSTDRGATFSRVEGIAGAMNELTGVRVMSADTIIVSGYEREMEGGARAWAVTTADGSSTSLPLPDGLTFPYVMSARAGRLALLARSEGQKLFWGSIEDFGAAQPLSLTSYPTGAIMAEDGQTLWIGGTDGGKAITRGTIVDDTVTWEEIAPDAVASCIGGDEDDLYLCGLGRLDGADLFRLDGDSASPVLDFQTVEGPRDCPDGTDVGDVCPVVWNEIAVYFDKAPPASPDAGPDAGSPPDGGADVDGAGPDGGPEASGGCCASAAHPTPAAPLGVLLLLVAFTVVRRR